MVAQKYIDIVTEFFDKNEEYFRAQTTEEKLASIQELIDSGPYLTTNNGDMCDEEYVDTTQEMCDIHIESITNLGQFAMRMKQYTTSSWYQTRATITMNEILNITRNLPYTLSTNAYQFEVEDIQEYFGESVVIVKIIK